MKRKPAKKRTLTETCGQCGAMYRAPACGPTHAATAAEIREARASVSLDGETNYCDACEADGKGYGPGSIIPTHRGCHRAPMTADERAVVEAAMALHPGGRYVSSQLDSACRRLRAARWK